MSKFTSKEIEEYFAERERLGLADYRDHTGTGDDVRDYINTHESASTIKNNSYVPTHGITDVWGR
tara:strand:+ start:3648 stop:3842 length:195 start_codon:yes stop_codon:yes gene_type:complete